MSSLPSPPAADNGLGSLADELAAAWSDEEEEEYGEGGVEGEDEEDGGDFDVSFANGTAAASYDYASDVGNESTFTSAMSTPQAIRILKARTPERKRTRLGNGGGSDSEGFGDETTDGISRGLEEQINNIRRLANGNTDAVITRSRNFSGLAYGLEEDEEEEEDVDEDVIERLMEGLQKLPPQSNVEAGTTRLITAHAALSSHLTNQTRSLRDLSFTIAQPPPEASEDLISIIPLIPKSSTLPAEDLSALHTLTLELIDQLASVSDTLNMARQSSIAANRKLRSAREACAEWKAELQSVERSKLWLETGGWEEKCKRREAGRVCGEVVQGFEMVCRGFEKRMREMEKVETC